MKKTLISLFFLFLFLFVGIEVFAENNSVTRVIHTESTYIGDDIPSEAYRMLDFRHYTEDNVTSYIESYLNNTNSVDHDYYFFTNAANSNVDITIRKTTNENVEITFVLFKLEYIENNNSYTKELTQIDCQSIEYDSNINSVNYHDTIDSGTYYILIFSTDVSVYNSNITYHIDFEMDKIECQSANITQLRLNKGLKGAIWLSELQPMNLDFNEAKGKLVYDKASDEYPEHLLEMIRAEETHLNYATIYLWDDELKYALFKIVSKLHNQLREKIELIQNQRLQLELIYNDITNTLEIVGYVLDGLELIPSISAAVEVASGVLDVAGEFVDTVFDAITPDFDYYDFTYLTFLDGLKEALDSHVGNYGNIDYIPNYNTIIIPLLYELSSNSSDLVMNYTVDYDYSFSMISKGLFNYHDKNIPTYGWEKISNETADDESDEPVYELVANNDFIGGNIYAITEDSDFNDISSLELVSECEDVMPYVNPILLNDGTDEVIQEYGYIWYSFTAPESKTYYVNSYAIDGLDKILVELFETPVAGYSEDEKITEYSSNFALDPNYSKTGCCFERYIEAGETIYFRVRGVNYEYLGEVDFEIESNQVPNYYHPHDYTYEYENIDSTKHYSYCECGLYIEENHNYNAGYVWKNNTQHYVSCVCGRTIVQGHAVLSGTTKCLLCKGNANMGFDILNIENSDILNIEYSNILIIEYECLIDFLNDPNKYYNKEENIDVS